MHHSRIPHTPEAGRPPVVDSEGFIDFDALGHDLTECDKTCRELFAHTHTACCGKTVVYHDGGRELSGEIYYEVEDSFTRCSSCKDFICRADSWFIDDARKKPLCYECHHKALNKAQEDDLLKTGLSIALEEVTDFARLMRSETNTTVLESCERQLAMLATAIQNAHAALGAKLTAHRSLPFVFGTQQ